MLISNSSRFIFIHLMKCAGSSVEASFRTYLAWNDIQLGTGTAGEILSGIYWRRYRLHKHASAAQVRQVVGPVFWHSCFTFATVRCPYERVASIWSYLAACVEPVLPDTEFPADADPQARMDWLASPTCPDRTIFRWDLSRAYLRVRGQRDPFSAFLRSEEFRAGFESQRSLLSDPETGELLVTMTIPAARLSERWPQLTATLGMSHVGFVTVNQTRSEWRTPTAELLRDPQDVAFIQHRFQDDFDSFGFDLRRRSRANGPPC